MRINERLNDQSTQSHSVNDRLMEKLFGLEHLVEEQRVQIGHLEANVRMTKAELSTPEKNVSRELFADAVNPSASQPPNHRMMQPEIPQAPIHRMAYLGTLRGRIRGLHQVFPFHE